VDFVAGKHLHQWMLGAQGYVVKQTTDDTIGGTTVVAQPGVFATGRRGQVVGVGPSAAYETKRHMSFMASCSTRRSCGIDLEGISVVQDGDSGGGGAWAVVALRLEVRGQRAEVEQGRGQNSGSCRST